MSAEEDRGSRINRSEVEASTALVHDDSHPWHAVSPPVAQTSLFMYPSVAAMEASFDGSSPRATYSRGDNPTVQAFEAKIAGLEGGDAARAFSSGMGAISAAVMSLVRAGDRIVCVRHVYPDAYRLFEKLLSRLGVAVDYVDGRDLDSVRRLLPGARLLYLESPTSVVFDVLDLRALAAAARHEGLVTIADNSWSTPLFQRPLALGVDLVVHSASKYLGGHSDVVAGIVVGSAARIAAINDLTYPYLGAKLSPFEAWLLLRGLRTLPLRMRQHMQGGLEVGRWLQGHPAVARVNHPGLSPASALDGCASLFSIELEHGTDVVRFCDSLSLFRLGVSWGGYESLVFPAVVGLKQAAGPNSLIDFGVSSRLVRLHVGLEDPVALVADLEQALEHATRPAGGA